MKHLKTILMLMLFFPVLGISQSYPDTLYKSVNGVQIPMTQEERDATVAEWMKNDSIRAVEITIDSLNQIEEFGYVDTIRMELGIPIPTDPLERRQIPRGKLYAIIKKLISSTKKQQQMINQLQSVNQQQTQAIQNLIQRVEALENP